ncbi:hypothetical protein HY995_05790 [Candidatus Micrarchaeota archaeon]|nr:hypothetical protein [Candidatus Micrarchaeota archaeon]MBI5177566.1 hypothetical protein [Candidatus Micrarchaeota archaeon]
MPKKETAKLSFESFVKEVSGDDGLKVVRSINGDGVTDEKIEADTKLKLVEIRALLNTLHNHGIVEYNREKNLQSGWFTYTWRVNSYRAMNNYLALKRRELEEVRRQTGGGENTAIYACPKGCAKLPFEKAAEFNFACESCSAKLKFADGTKELKELEGKISAIEALVKGQA